MSFSNVNDAGIPIDHDGEALELGLDFGTGAGGPILVAASVLEELLADRNNNLVEEPHHLEADLNDVFSMPSSSGGIPIARNASGDCESIEDEFCNTINPNIRAAFAINDQEREELSRARRVIQELQGSS